jgi:hypothetical protein
MVGFELFDRSQRQTGTRRPFPDSPSSAELAEMAAETRAERKRARGWRPLLPAATGELDVCYAAARRPAVAALRRLLQEDDPEKTD